MTNWIPNPINPEDPYRRGYRDGWKDAMDSLGKPAPSPISSGCPKCGVVLEGVTGYYCPRSDCPIFMKAT